MVLVSGPPFGEYPPGQVDGTTVVKYNGKYVSNVFDIKRQIFERENNNFRSLQFYRDTSKELLNLFSDAQILGVDLEIASVPCWYANYERAIAKIFQARTLTLPVMTIAISDTAEDLKRRRPNFDIEFWTVKDKKRRKYTRVASLAPKAVTVSYTLNLWARYVEDMNQLLEYVMQKFHPHLRVETDFATNTCAFITAVSDNSTLDAPDREDRVLRKTVTFEVESYMPSRQYMIQSNGDIADMYMNATVEAPQFSGMPSASSVELLGFVPPSSTL